MSKRSCVAAKSAESAILRMARVNWSYHGIKKTIDHPVGIRHIMNAVHGLSFVLHHIVVRADVILRKSRFEADIKLEDLLVGDRVAILPSEGLIHRRHRLCIKGSVWILIHEFFIESNVGADVSQIVDSHTENHF